MSEQTHTRGPWIWRSLDGGKTFFLGTLDRGCLIVMDFERRGMQRAAARFATRTGDEGGIMETLTLEEVQTHPDARLIAAAPDLLKACKEAKAAFGFIECECAIPGNEQGCVRCDGIATIDAVLAKVEGRQ